MTPSSIQTIAEEGTFRQRTSPIEEFAQRESELLCGSLLSQSLSSKSLSMLVVQCLEWFGLLDAAKIGVS